MLRKLFFVFALLSVHCVFAQQFLSVKINYQTRNKAITDVLFDLSELGGFDFSYSAKLFVHEPVITLSEQGKTVKSVLDNITAQCGIRYRTYETGIVLYKPEPKRVVRVTHFVYGVVYNDSDHQVVQGVKIEEPFLAIVTESDSNGIFKIRVPNPDYRIQLQFVKEGFQMREVKMRLQDDQQLKVVLIPNSIIPKEDQKIQIAEDTSTTIQEEEVAEEVLKIAKENKIQQALLQPFNKLNIVKNVLKDNLRKVIEDTSEIHLKGIQVGLMPPISTDFSNSGLYTHRVSISAFLTYNAGLSGAGFSGLGSFTHYNSKGANFTGLFSLTGGKMEGAQFSGIVGIGRMKVTGVQASGIMSVSGLDMKGVQASGVVSTTFGYMTGVQLSGVYNVATKGGNGVQATGVFNHFQNTSEGIQLAGVLNLCEDSLKGVQVATINIAEEIQGAQIGVVNVCSDLKGTQIGVVNIVKTVSEGIPFGVLTFVKDGYKQLDLVYKETGMTNLRFKTGTDKLYNIIGAGYQPKETFDDFYWSAIYGFGRKTRLKGRWFLSGDVTANQLFGKQFSSSNLNLITSLELTLGYHTKLVNVVVGPSLNVLFSDRKGSYSINNGIEIPQQDTPWGNAWAGFTVGFQFL